jgi:2,4-dienoyl-CoA reductase-like NADH-dependent reductase (Old Yellow Enzyme family)
MIWHVSSSTDINGVIDYFIVGFTAFYVERAKGEAGLIVTGGIAPNPAGRTAIGGAKLSTKSEASMHKVSPYNRNL